MTNDKIRTAKSRWAILSFVILFVAVFFSLQLRLYRGLHTGFADLVFFEQPLANTLRGRFFQLDMGHAIFGGQYRGVTSMFSEHLYLIMLAVLPLYALIPHTAVLFFLQALAGGLGGLAVFLIARERWGSEWAAVCLGLAYLLYPAVQGMTLGAFNWGFHADTLFPPLFLLAYYFLLTGRRRLFAVFFLLSLSTVESVALLWMAFGLWLALTDRERRRTGGAVFGGALAWWAVAVLVVIPRFREGALPYYFSASGGLAAVWHDPGLIVEWAAPLGRYVVYLLGPVLFLPLLSPLLAAVAVPNLLVNLAARAAGYTLPTSPNAWHAAPIVAVVFVSAIEGMGNLRRWLPGSDFRSLRGFGSLAALVLVATALADYWAGPLPFSRGVSPDQFAVDPLKARDVAAVKALLPAEGSLSVEFFIGSHFTQRSPLYEFPEGWHAADYVLVDVQPRGRWYEAKQATFEKLERSPAHELVYRRGSVYLFQRRRYPPPEHAVGADFGGLIRLVGYDLEAGSWKLETGNWKPGGEIRLTLHWQALADVDTSYTVFLHLFDAEGVRRGQLDVLPGGEVYPTDEWVPGETVVDTYSVPVDEDAPPGEYTVQVGLYDVTTMERLPVVGAAGGENAVELGPITVGD